MLKRFSVNQKLLFLVLVLCAIIAGIGIYGINRLNTIKHNAQTLYADRVLCMGQLSAIRYNYLENILPVVEAVKYNTDIPVNANIEVANAIVVIDSNWKAYKATYLTREEAGIVKTTDSLKNVADNALVQFSIYLKSPAAGTKASTTPVASKLPAIIASMVAQLNGLLQLQINVSQHLDQNSNAVYQAAVLRFFAVIGIAVLFAIALSYFILGDTHRLINNLEESNRKIAASEAKCRAFIEHAGDAILILNKEFKIIELNNSAIKLLGYSRDELTTLDIRHIVPEVEHQRQAELIDQLRKGEPFNPLYERKLIRKDGNQVDTEINIQPLNGYGFVAIMRDITGRLKAQEMQMLLASIINYSEDAIISKTLDGIITSWNKGAEKLFGYISAEAAGKHITMLIPNDRRKEEDEIIKMINKGEVVEHLETQRIHKDGHLIDISLTVSPLKDAFGNITGASKVARNITTRKKTQQLLEAILDYAPENIVLLNKDYKILCFNKTMQNTLSLYFGKKIQLMDDYRDFVVPDHMQLFLESFSKAINGEIVEVESETKGPGFSIWFEYKMNAVYGHNGELLGVSLSAKDITERKKAVEKVEKHESELTSFFENADGAACLLDINKRYVIFNKRFAYDNHLLTGHEPIAGEEVYEHFPQQIKTERHKMLDDVLQGNKKIIEADYMRNGRRVYYRTSFNPVIANGNVIGITTYSIDLTENRESQFALMRSEEKHRALVENISDGITLIDEKGNVVYQSPSVARISGYTNEEAVGKKAADFIYPPDLPVFQEFFKRVYDAPGVMMENPYRIVHKNGDVLWVEGTVINLLHNESVKAIVANYRDVTERKSAHQEILRLSRLYQFISQINEAILKLDNEEEIFTAACRIAVETGKFQMAWIGTYDEENDRITPTAWAGFEDGFLKTIPESAYKASTSSIPSARAIRLNTHFYYNDIETAQDIPYAIKNEMLKRNYRSGLSLPIFIESKVIAVFVLLMSEPDFFNEGEVNLLREVTDNITYALDKIRLRRLRAKAEEEIRILNESLEQKVEVRTAQLSEANKALESFSYTVAHDLRAPVRQMIGFTRIIEEDHMSALNDDLKTLFGFINTGGKRMNTIIEDLFTLAKFERVELNATKVDMEKMFRHVWDNLRLQNRHQAQLIIDVLPSANVDASLIEQVIVNLLSNAVKYSSKKEQPLIHVSFEQGDDTITYMVKDNGAGFDMKNYSRLFGAFQRLHGASEFEGTGVGLMLVKRIIEKHGGVVRAEGAVDQGATFYFTLPVAV